ncbi:hypothetical protein VVD49_12960 [Uliginosibacterium sp. H3]|uniref:DUF4175 domain-containing protein n=1 Tax=Uliginosibacterium silvisoli TaxID=3114758 RepID=A0ABU6K4W3_9RHOO|nr:hypothetical protein [Uliginosibacterium sp. H3]
MKTSSWISLAALLAALIVEVSAMVHGAGKFEWSWFYAWANAPYVVLALIFCLPVGQSRARANAGGIAGIFVLAFTAWLYINAMWISVSSTSALIFIFAPPYVGVGGLVVWGLSWWWLARRAASRGGDAAS